MCHCSFLVPIEDGDKLIIKYFLLAETPPSILGVWGRPKGEVVGLDSWVESTVG